MKYDFDTIYDRRDSGCFKYDALKMIYGRDDLIPLWVADMDFAVSPEIQAAIRSRTQHPIYGYNLRLPEFYDAVIDWQSKRFQWQIEKDWIIAVPGVVPAIALAILGLTEPNDGVLIQTPVYAPFAATILAHHRTLITNPLIEDRGIYSIDFADFESKISKARLFILCNPHNPVGRVFNGEELTRMGEICRRHQVSIFSDEIHADIVYEGFKHMPIASLPGMSDIVVTGFSPAKSFNIAGLSTAIAVAENPKLRNPIHYLNQNLHIYLGNSIGIAALIAAYRDSEAWLEELLAYLQGNRDYVSDYLSRHMPDIGMTPQEGTYLAWLDFRRTGLSDMELENMMLNDARIALNDGPGFGVEGRGFMRLNFACPRAVLTEALSRINKALKDRL